HAAPTNNSGRRRRWRWPMGPDIQGSTRVLAGRMAGAILSRRRRMKYRRAITELRRLRIMSSRILKRTSRNAKNLSIFTVAIARTQGTLEQQHRYGDAEYLQRPPHMNECAASSVPQDAGSLICAAETSASAE